MIPHDYLNGSYAVAKRTTGGGAVDYGMQFQGTVDENNIEEAVWRNSGFADLDLVKSASGSWHDHWITWAGTMDSVGRDFYIWSDDGDNQEIVNQTGGAILQGTGPLGLHHRPAEFRVFAGMMDYTAIFSVRKSKAFIESFRANPWQIFQPRTAYLPFEAVGYVQPEIQTENIIHTGGPIP